MIIKNERKILMPFDDFRQFLSFLEEQGELVRVKREVDPYLETTLVAKKSIEEEGPALLFENVKGHSIPLAVGVYGTQRRVCLGLDTTPRDFVREYVRRGERLWNYAPRLVKDGPCKENIILGDDVDLRKFPITWHAPLDKGWYIDATVCIVQHPETRVRNASVHRLFIHEKKQTGLWMSPFNLWHIIQLYWERGLPCPMAVAIGTDPAVMMAASTSMPLEWDEFAYAGAQRGKPVDMVRCETIDVEVPATAEIIIEGLLPPHERKLEAPFVEFTGYYGDERLAPVFNVTAITHRNNPIYNDIVTGPPPDENQPMLITNAAEVFQVLKRVFPEESIVDVYLTPGGCTYFNCVVSIKKRYPGHGRQVATAVLAYQGVKNVIVVDDDIDARNQVQVEWAVATRSRGQADMIFINDSLGCPLDPTTTDAAVNKVGIDATKPVGTDKILSTMVNMPCYYPTHNVDLSEYIPGWEKRRGDWSPEGSRRMPGVQEPFARGRVAMTTKNGYRCHRCGVVVYVAEGDPAPTFCKNCAVTHIKSDMQPLPER